MKKDYGFGSPDPDGDLLMNDLKIINYDPQYWVIVDRDLIMKKMQEASTIIEDCMI